VRWRISCWSVGVCVRGGHRCGEKQGVWGRRVWLLMDEAQVVCQVGEHRDLLCDVTRLYVGHDSFICAK